MNRTFYIPKGKEETMHEFVEICTSKNINYSTLLVEWIENFNKLNKYQQNESRPNN